MEAVCRICMDSSVALVNIFEERKTLSSEEPSLADMLNECAGCKVREDDKLPRQICDTCVLDCLNAFRFKRTSEQSQERFMELLREQEKETEQTKCDTKQTSCNEAKKVEEDKQLLVICKEEKEEQMSETEAEEWQLTESSVDLDCVKIENSVFVSCGEETALKIKDTAQQQMKTQFTQKADPSGIVSLNRTITLNATGGKFIPIDKASPLSGKIYRCINCGKEFLQMDKLTKHQNIHNSEFRPFKCFYCPNTFAKRSFLNAHLRTHTDHDDRPYKCKHCAKSFYRLLHLEEHMFTHRGEWPYKCNKCDKKFRSLPGFRHHICSARNLELRRYIKKNLKGVSAL